MSLPSVGPRKLVQLHQYHVFEVGVAAATLQPHYVAAPESSERSGADLIHSRSFSASDTSLLDRPPRWMARFHFCIFFCSALKQKVT